MREAVREAVAAQRAMAIQEDEAARKTILAAGCEIVEPTAAELSTFAAAVKPLLAEACDTYGYGRAALRLVGQ